MCLIWYYVSNGSPAVIWGPANETNTVSKPMAYSSLLHRCLPAERQTKMRRSAVDYLCPSSILVNRVRVSNRFETMYSTHGITNDLQYFIYPDRLIDIIKRNFHYTVCTGKVNNVIMQDKYGYIQNNYIDMQVTNHLAKSI